MAWSERSLLLPYRLIQFLQHGIQLLPSGGHRLCFHLHAQQFGESFEVVVDDGGEYTNMARVRFDPNAGKIFTAFPIPETK